MAEEEQARPMSDFEKSRMVVTLIHLREDIRDRRKKRYNDLYRKFREYRKMIDPYSNDDSDFKRMIENDLQIDNYNRLVVKYDQELRRLDEKAWLRSWEG